MRRYLEALRHRDFAALWTGATLSTLGDGMTLVALTWLVYERTGSPVALGWLAVAWTAPVVVGGLAAGVLLDRFDRRRVLMVDTLGRGLVMASVPVLAMLDVLPTWYLFVVAAVYGLLKMVPLAGVPSMIPSLVPAAHLTTANALESISYGVGGIVGPAVAGLLIGLVGAPAVIAIDAATYFSFLGCLALMRTPVEPAPRTPERGAIDLGPAVRLLLASPPILATTLMFMAFNVGEGVFIVALPVYAGEVLAGDAAAYGWLLASFSVGLLAGSFVVGALPTPARLGRAIAAGQTFAGIVALAWLARPGLAVALAVGVAFGLASSPLTIWAQTMRMQLIPPEVRGRFFALLRTLMQGTPPIGGIVAGFLVAGGGLGPAMLVAALVIGLPGVVGLLVPALAGPVSPVVPAVGSPSASGPAPDAPSG